MQTNFYRVGGCVRDALLGIKSKDIDFSVEAESYDAMKDAIFARGGTIFLEKSEFLTIRAKVPNLGDADFVLCRKDGAYSDGRRPDEVVPGTLLDDLARRDFTINAIAETESGEIIDPFDGRRDLEHKLIRCVGSVERLREDSLRMLRALRFATTKKMYLHHEISSFLADGNNSALLRNISIERIREELKKMFEADSLTSIMLLNQYDNIRNEIFRRNIKLVPTIIG